MLQYFRLPYNEIRRFLHVFSSTLRCAGWDFKPVWIKATGFALWHRPEPWYEYGLKYDLSCLHSCQYLVHAMDNQTD